MAVQEGTAIQTDIMGLAEEVLGGDFALLLGDGWPSGGDELYHSN